LREIVLLNEIKQKLDRARSLAIEAGGFTLFYLIEIALLEVEEMSKKHKPLGDEARRLDDPKAH
jgi:hypothetical protein